MNKWLIIIILNLYYLTISWQQASWKKKHLEYRQTNRQTVKSSRKSLKKKVNSRPGHEYFSASPCPYWLCGSFYLLLRSHQDSSRKTDWPLPLPAAWNEWHVIFFRCLCEMVLRYRPQFSIFYSYERIIPDKLYDLFLNDHIMIFQLQTLYSTLKQLESWSSMVSAHWEENSSGL